MTPKVPIPLVRVALDPSRLTVLVRTPVFLTVSMLGGLGVPLLSLLTGCLLVARLLLRCVLCLVWVVVVVWVVVDRLSVVLWVLWCVVVCLVLVLCLVPCWDLSSDSAWPVWCLLMT